MIGVSVLLLKPVVGESRDRNDKSRAITRGVRRYQFSGCIAAARKSYVK